MRLCKIFIFYRVEFDRTTEANQIVVLEKTDIYFVTSDMDSDNFYKKMKNLL